MSVIRRFEESDLERLNEICSKCYDGRDFLPSVASKLLADKAVSFFAMENEKGELVAVSVTQWMDDGKVAYFMGLRVASEARRHGHAASLLKHQLADATARGAKVGRFVRDSNTQATKAIATACGFEFVAFWPVLRWECEVLKQQVQWLKAHSKGTAMLEQVGSVRELVADVSRDPTFAAELLYSSSWKPYPVSAAGIDAFLAENKELQCWKLVRDGKLVSFSVSMHGPGSSRQGGHMFVYISRGAANDACALLAAHYPEDLASFPYEDTMVIFGSEDIRRDLPDLFSHNVAGLKGSSASLVEKKLN
jgi:N-acetylglutamate synthase-like GNAT family acetyltransferase